jgi:hypothetical protein
MAQALPELHRRRRGHLAQAPPPNIMASIDAATLINHFPRQRKAYSGVRFPPLGGSRINRRACPEKVADFLD